MKATSFEGEDKSVDNRIIHEEHDDESQQQSSKGDAFMNIDDSLLYDAEESQDDDYSPDNNSNNDSIIGSKETRLVNFSKALVAVVIVLMAVAISVVTFINAYSAEMQEFQNQFATLANGIVKVSNIRAKNIFDNLGSTSATLTSNTIARGDVWPFVSIKNFEVEGMLSNEATGASVLSVIPLVQPNNREQWEQFSVQRQDWISQGQMYQREVNPKLYGSMNFTTASATEPNATKIVPFIYHWSNFSIIREDDADFYAPSWLVAPAPTKPYANLNLRRYNFDRYIVGLLEHDQPVLTPLESASYLDIYFPGRFTEEELKKPHSYLQTPIYDNFFKNRTIVGVLSAFIRWDNFFVNLIPESEFGVNIILEGCGDTFTYELNGFETKYRGQGDLHDEKYDGMEIEFEFASFASLKQTSASKDEEKSFCTYTARIFPSDDFQGRFLTMKPYMYAATVSACFLITSLVFLIYDFMVQQRNKAVMDTATKTSAIVSSLFPSNVRDRLIQELTNIEGNFSPKKKDSFLSKHSGSTRHSTSQIESSESIFGSEPIADLFPKTTILFADMVGFTAWASVREPTQVFTLLESVYHAYDMIAKRMRVFKVETIGDCYVAVAGLPTGRADHAVVMARFAARCMDKMAEVSLALQTTLGPDTADLGMRMGLHSGPVTAGVLRGDKGRFQLFGDTVNTTSRIETTGMKGRIHMSSDTAELLIAAGKGDWVILREQKVVAKGKGELQTYWLKDGMTTEMLTSSSQRTTSTLDGGSLQFSLNNATIKAKPQPVIDNERRQEQQQSIMEKEAAAKIANKCSISKKKFDCLIQWNVELLAGYIKRIVAKRDRSRSILMTLQPNFFSETSILDEVQDVVPVVRKHQVISGIKKQRPPGSIHLSPKVMSQLDDFVGNIARMYRKNPFHNFEHASHVTMSVTKLLNRIVNPSQVSKRNGRYSANTNDGNRSDEIIAADLHDQTFGIASDPLTQFACVFSALIHDVDHPGVPNQVLVRENQSLATKYGNKSVAEQNSVILGWNLLMNSSKYTELRSCICANDDEVFRFRQLVVNVVMATDIMDKNLGQLRKDRWDKAFSRGSECASSSTCNKNGEGSSSFVPTDRENKVINLKATIVLEHLIQASDVAHTMQHWAVYKKWNEYLFREIYAAYKEGREGMDKNPCDFWYRGEIGFFDNYIIPLARKLEACGVFGASSDEYLNYALTNRQEWEEKGEQIVQEYLEKYRKEEEKQIRKMSA